MNSELLFLSKNERQHKHGQYRFGLAYGVYRHFQQYFSLIVVLSFIGGGKRRKPLTCHNSLTNVIT
jgi:hypothetical protein